MPHTHWCIKIISLISLAFIIVNSSYASYLYINYQDSSYSRSTYTGSIPYSSSGFYYSDPRGNSISYSQTRSIPVIVNQYPGAVWIFMGNNAIPANAIVLQYVNGNPTFYCRIQSGNAFFYGQLIPNQGCYVPSISHQLFNAYQVLVR